jgi:hypothetical protein
LQAQFVPHPQLEPQVQGWQEQFLLEQFFVMSSFLLLVREIGH